MLGWFSRPVTQKTPRFPWPSLTISKSLLQLLQSRPLSIEEEDGAVSRGGASLWKQMFDQEAPRKIFVCVSLAKILSQSHCWPKGGKREGICREKKAQQPLTLRCCPNTCRQPQGCGELAWHHGWALVFVCSRKRASKAPSVTTTKREETGPASCASAEPRSSRKPKTPHLQTCYCGTFPTKVGQAVAAPFPSAALPSLHLSHLRHKIFKTSSHGVNPSSWQIESRAKPFPKTLSRSQLTEPGSSNHLSYTHWDAPRFPWCMGPSLHQEEILLAQSQVLLAVLGGVDRGAGQPDESTCHTFVSL